VKAIFWARHEVGRVEESDYRELNLAQALQNGAKVLGDEVEIRTVQSAYEADVLECDLVILAGVKSRHWFTAYAQAGIPWLYFDKGYIRERAETQWLEYWRMSVNSHHPIEYLAKAKHDHKRADEMRFRFAPWKLDRGNHIVVDGGSEKNFKFNGIVPESATIGDIDAHCARLVAKIRDIAPHRPVIYRPKPSSKGRKALDGTEFAYKGRTGVHIKDVGHDLDRAHAVVTYNGAISFDAHRLGIPSIVLGSGPGRPISSTSLDEIENPYLAPVHARQQWLNNLAWCQFDMVEYANGLAWGIVKEMMACTPVKTPAEACPCSPL
jgi:hypothetical protein